MRKTHLRTRPEGSSRGGRSRSLPPITQPHGSQADRSKVSQLAAAAVALRDVRKVYAEGEDAVVALDGISIGFAPGSFTAIMGPSGSGKSTFLHMAAGLDRPTAGTVLLGDIVEAGDDAPVVLPRVLANRGGVVGDG